MKLWINPFFAWLSIWSLIKSFDITKEFIVWILEAVVLKITSCSSIAFQGWYYLHNFELLVSFGECKEIIIYILSISDVQPKSHMIKLIKFLFSKFPHVENFWRQWNLDDITVTKILKWFMTNSCRKWRNRFKKEKSVVLPKYMKKYTDSSKYKRKIKLIKKKSFMEELLAFTFPCQTNRNHATRAIKSQPHNLRLPLEKYFRFHWNCKQLRVEARNSM